MVTYFDDVRGYGFIKRSAGRDVFFHHSAIQMEGWRALLVGDSVTFEVVQGAQGLQAANVRKVSE